MKMEIYGIKTNENTVAILHVEDGAAVTRFDDSMPVAYPVDSNVSALYEHPEGIVLTLEDAERLGIEIED